MSHEGVQDVLRDFDAMAAECGGLEAATIHAMTVRLSVANAREVESLQLALDNEQAKGVHSCGVYCERPLCVMTRRAKAAEADARRYSFLAHKCNHGDEYGVTAIRFSSVALPDAAIDAAISGDDGEIVPSGCGVEARIHFEDPRYPTLVLDGDEFGTIGYELCRDTGELRRVCICHAYCEHECVCGYDAAISAERDNTRSGRDG